MVWQNDLMVELYHSVNFGHLSDYRMAQLYSVQTTEQKIIVLLNNNFERFPVPKIQQKYFKDFKTNATT